MKPDKNAVEAFATEIVDLLKEEVFEVEGLPQAVVKYEEGHLPGAGAGSHFRKKELMPGWEFMLSGAYVGKSEKLLITFVPVDKHEWDSVEVEAAKVDTVFPLVGPALAEKFGIKTTERFKEAFEIAFEKRQEERLREAEANYKSNPLFGMF